VITRECRYLKGMTNPLTRRAHENVY